MRGIQKLILVLPLFIAACGTRTYNDYLRMYGLPDPAADNFIHCYDYGCKTQVRVGLSSHTEKQLKRLFKKPAKSSADERDKISQAIAFFEKDIGAQTGTENDKFGTFKLYGDDAATTRRFQQDCVDESTNTTTYLALLEKMGYMTRHHVIFPATRQPILSGKGWWHQTATIIDNETNEVFAVDSWFRDNGYPAYIVPIEEWKNGWSPSKITN